MVGSIRGSKTDVKLRQTKPDLQALFKKGSNLR